MYLYTHVTAQVCTNRHWSLQRETANLLRYNPVHVTDPPKLLICSDLWQLRNNLISRNAVFCPWLHNSLVYYFWTYFISSLAWCRMYSSVGTQVWMFLGDPVAKAEVSSHRYLMLLWLHGATGAHPPVAWARVALQSGVSVPLGIPTSRAWQSPGRSDEPLLRDVTPPWVTGPAKDELYAAVWIWRGRARGCRDRGGRAWCPAPAGRRSSALANACGRSAGACWWQAALGWIPAKRATVVPGCLGHRTPPARASQVWVKEVTLSQTPRWSWPSLPGSRLTGYERGCSQHVLNDTLQRDVVRDVEVRPVGLNFFFFSFLP